MRPAGASRPPRTRRTPCRNADASLRQAGVGGDLRSGGSTPTAALAIEGALNEMRPGVYVFNDAQQSSLAAPLGRCRPDRGGHGRQPHGRDLVLGRWEQGAGSRSTYAGRLGVAGCLTTHRHESAPCRSTHATANFPRRHAGCPSWESLVRVAPNHVCAAVNLADVLMVTAGGAVVDEWQVAAPRQECLDVIPSRWWAPRSASRLLTVSHALVGHCGQRGPTPRVFVRLAHPHDCKATTRRWYEAGRDLPSGWSQRLPGVRSQDTYLGRGQRCQR
jgi:hypothetical protein